MLAQKEFPEFFIREELVLNLLNLGEVLKAKKICQEQIDRIIKKRRVNIGSKVLSRFVRRPCECILAPS